MEGSTNGKNVKLDPKIFWPALVVLVGLTIPLALNVDTAGPILNKILHAITNQFAWLFEIAVLGIAVFLIWLAFSRYGKLRFGTEKPEFSNLTWFGLLFTAGMGTSIMFWAFMEPMHYLISPPFGFAPHSIEAAEWAIPYGMFHWGITGWGIYCIPTLAIAFSYYVLKYPTLRISTACKGVLGDKADGWLGKVIDIAIIWGLVGGLATSLGLGVPMVSQCVSHITGIPRTFTMDVVIIICWIALFSGSAYLGLYKGIKWLANINIYLAIGLAAFAFLVGPTSFVLNNAANSLGLMLQNIIRMSLWTDPIANSGFPQAWTVFYWAWWFTSAPFMGLFVARVSRGRTVREIIFAEMVLGPLGCWIWFWIFGGYGLHLELNHIVPVTKILQESGGPQAVVAILNSFPVAWLIIPIFTILAFIFLATSLDSATYVLASIASKELTGTQQPAKWHRLLWALVMGSMTLVLLKIGGLNVIQTSAVVFAIPVLIIFLLLAVSFFNWAKEEMEMRDLAATAVCPDHEEGVNNL
ncbi:MAG: BCCT family transporter [Syntrophaceticus sp.]